MIPAITTTPPIVAITVGINSNVGWAKQLRQAIDAGAVYITIANEATGRLFDGNCFAPTIDDRNGSLD